MYLPAQTTMNWIMECQVCSGKVYEHGLKVLCKKHIMPSVIQSPSPNYSSSTHKKIGVQIHKTLGLMPWTLQWLQNPANQVSAHILFARNGDIHQLVQLGNRSWSAGRIVSPSPRALSIMKKTWWGSWVKPGHYLVQCEFECLSNQTFTVAQYESAVWYFKNHLDFEVTDSNLLEHQDTASDKPELDPERTEILRRLQGVGTSVPQPPSNEAEKEQIKQQIRQLLNQL